MVWVDEYIRDDGTKVRGHWRSKPDGNGSGIKGSIQKSLSGDAVSGEEEGNPILNAIYEVLSRITNQETEETEEGLPTGGAAGIEKSLDSASTVTNWKTGEKFQMNWDENGKIFYTDSKGNKIDFRKTPWENAQQLIYENLFHQLYPMASNSTIDGMHDFRASKQQYDVKVYNDMKNIDNQKYRNYLCKLGATETSPGVIYGEHSDVSQNIANSPEFEGYLAEIRDKVLKGEPLEDKDLIFNASLHDAIFQRDRFDRMAAFRKVRLLDPKVDENGVFTAKILDFSDFVDEPIVNIEDIPNKWGYEMSRKGYYQNYYQVINIRKKVNW